MSKASILVSFCFAVLLLSSSYQVPTLVDSVKAADSWDEELNEKEDPRVDASRPRLREGTRIASVVGKFSRVGRRWMLELEPIDDASQETASNNLKRDQTSNDKLAPADTIDATKDRSASKKNVEPNLTRYRVLENLTLQRVVDAITQDPNDVRWVASGTITEFDGENWLLLSTVFRAHAATESATLP